MYIEKEKRYLLQEIKSQKDPPEDRNLKKINHNVPSVKIPPKSKKEDFALNGSRTRFCRSLTAWEAAIITVRPEYQHQSVMRYR